MGMGSNNSPNAEEAITIPAVDVSVNDSWSRAIFERDFLAKSQPVLIRGLLSSALRQWDQQTLLRENGEQLVDVEHYPNRNRSDAFTFRRMRLRDYVELVESDEEAQEQYYLAEKPLDQMLPGSAKDYVVPSVIPGGGNPRTVGFFGYNTYTTCHYHKLCTQAILSQVIGTKRIVFFPPSEHRLLYMTPWYGMRPNHSTIPFDRASHGELCQNFPRLAKATSISIDLQPGDSLYIPDHWFHTAEGIGCSLSITTFWDDATRYAYAPGLYRDRASEVFKSACRGAGHVATTLGMQPHLLKLASKLGIIKASEVDTIADYVAEHGVTAPNKIEREA